MKIKLSLFLIVIVIASCGPYRGFKGVNPKGMSKSTLPSEGLRKDMKRSEKRQARTFKREMKKRARDMGTTKKR